MSTYRERREAKADRLREWSDKRAAKSDAELSKADAMASVIPFGQPIMVGHYSEGRDRRYRDRIGAAMDRGLEHHRKAENMASRATEIERQLDHSIYSDDDDAIERLTERIAGLEAERDRIKRYNASCRKGARDVSILTDAEQADLASTARVASYMIGKNGEMPRYKLANLSGNIKRNRDRLALLQRSQSQ